MKNDAEKNIAEMQISAEQIAQKISVYEVHHLPIVRGYLERMDLIPILNRLISTEMEVEPGVIVAGMIIDTLSGRSPLYRIPQYFKGKDIELLIGRNVEAEVFNDDNVGRVLDLIYETGTQKIFSEISLKAINEFEIDTAVGHMDTTSHRVWGEYRTQEKELEEPKNPDQTNTKKELSITYGHSKDHRPDLKQFITSLLCVEKNIPIMHKIEDGNKQDKTINNELLTSISSKLAKYKIADDAFTYIGDSAVVTKANLEQLADMSFITRLPATYNECARVIEEAIDANKWIPIGIISETPATKNRKPAEYKVYDSEVCLYDKKYRAVVVHSSSHNHRMEKRLSKEIEQESDYYQKTLSAFMRQYACKKDAEQTVQKMTRVRSTYHQAVIEIKETPIYAPGRVPKNGERKVVGSKYSIEFKIEKDQELIDQKKQNSGCFVLISQLLDRSDRNKHSPENILRLYKEQHGVERNFSFLKDEMIVNALFLKSPARIEALGFILVLTLLVWNLMERSMRQFTAKNPGVLDGWDKKKTNKPTSFMMTTKFQSILVMHFSGKRMLARPLTEIQLTFLRALNLSPDIFIRSNSS